jgi:hypothetical protein
MLRIVLSVLALTAAVISRAECSSGVCENVTAGQCYTNCIGTSTDPAQISQCSFTCNALGGETMCQRNCRASGTADPATCEANCNGSSYNPVDLCQRNCEQSYNSGMRTISINTAIKGIETDYTRRNADGVQVRSYQLGSITDCHNYCSMQGGRPGMVEVPAAATVSAAPPESGMVGQAKPKDLNAIAPPKTVSNRLGDPKNAFDFRNGPPVTICGGRPNCVDETTFHPTAEEAAKAKQMADELKAVLNAADSRIPASDTEIKPIGDDLRLDH